MNMHLGHIHYKIWVIPDRSNEYKRFLPLFLLLFFSVSAAYSHPQKRQIKFNIKQFDRKRVLKMANKYLDAKPITVTDSLCPRSAGGIHDYYSEGDYWWPNPDNPNGPYIRRDGYTNPNNFDFDRKAMRRFDKIAATETAAYIITGNKKYAAQAVKHLRAWFINKKTYMNPNLKYSQAIKGKVTGRGIGIIDTIHLVEVARSAKILEQMGYLAGKNRKEINEWFSKYLHWLTTSKFGINERDHGNNHSTAWAVQVSEFADLVGNDSLKQFCRHMYKNTILPDQMTESGSFPKELARTKPYGYSLFNLDMMTTLVQILSDSIHDLWHYKTPNGKSIGKALAFMYPYIKDKSKWPYKQDVMYWDKWPIQQPPLLFGGLALDKPKYIRLWKTLKPNPTTPEIIRNDPIRQPVLWISLR
jgi:hypothetical protein